MISLEHVILRRSRGTCSVSWHFIYVFRHRVLFLKSQPERQEKMKTSITERSTFPSWDLNPPLTLCRTAHSRRILCIHRSMFARLQAPDRRLLKAQSASVLKWTNDIYSILFLTANFLQFIMGSLENFLIMSVMQDVHVCLHGVLPHICK